MRLSSQDETFDRAGGLSGRRFRYAPNFSGFVAGWLRNTKPEKCRELRKWSVRRRPERPPLAFGHSCGRQSCLQAAFQAAFSIHAEFLRLRRSMPDDTKPEKYPAAGRAALDWTS
jgi:hypothetical protein